MQNRNDRYNVVAAIIDKKGTILSIARNSFTKTHPVNNNNNYYKEEQKYIHAETYAIAKLHKTESAYAMIVCRTLKDGTFVNAKPCKGCYCELKKTGLKNVYYTNKDGLIEKLNMTISVEDFEGSKND
jgi:tRNA(Arg) A34 adenosine deaminase TadA